LRSKCYFCDTELEVIQYTFQVGPKDEAVCEECHLKTENRQRAKAEEDGRKGSS
jgi:hypothetical protein